MKTISIITAALLIALVILAAIMAHAGKRYDRGYLDGYNHRQFELLPEIGIDNKKRPAPGLLGKG